MRWGLRWGLPWGWYDEGPYGVEVRKINNKILPCINCRYYNNKLHPKTSIHSLQQEYRKSLLNIKFRNSFIGFTNLLGKCFDYSPKS
jgi:hypothetical protein